MLLIQGAPSVHGRNRLRQVWLLQASRLMTNAIDRLREKLCRELAQSEYDAVIHSRREASRYGAEPPAQVLRTIAAHAVEVKPRLDEMWAGQSVGIGAAHVVGELFSSMRHFAFDWLIDAERSYRATILGLRHGLGVAVLLREVLIQQRDRSAQQVCADLVEVRTRLVCDAERELRWFAEHPDAALRSSRGGARQISDASASR